MMRMMVIDDHDHDDGGSSVGKCKSESRIRSTV